MMKVFTSVFVLDSARANFDDEEHAFKVDRARTELKSLAEAPRERAAELHVMGQALRIRMDEKA